MAASNPISVRLRRDEMGVLDEIARRRGVTMTFDEMSGVAEALLPVLDPR